MFSGFSSIISLYQIVLILGGLSFVSSKPTLPVTSKHTVAIAVESFRMDSLKNHIKVFRRDLVREGWQVVVTGLDSGKGIMHLHSQLDTLYKKHYMQGVILIGSFAYVDGYQDDRHLADENFSPNNDWLTVFRKNRPRFWVSRIDSDKLQVDHKTPLQDLELQNHWIRDYLDRNSRFRRCLECVVDADGAYQYVYSKYKAYDFIYTSPLELNPKVDAIGVTKPEEFFHFLNNSKSYTSLLMAHGSNDSIALTEGWLDMMAIVRDSHAFSRVLILNSCSVGAPVMKNPASAFLFAPDSKTLAVIAVQNELPIISYLESMNTDVHVENAGMAFLRNSLLSMKSLMSTVLGISIIDIALNDLSMFESSGFTWLPAILSNPLVDVAMTTLTLLGLIYAYWYDTGKLILLGDGTLVLRGE